MYTTSSTGCGQISSTLVRMQQQSGLTTGPHNGCPRESGLKACQPVTCHLGCQREPLMLTILVPISPLTET